MSDEPPADTVEITAIHEFSKLNRDLSRTEFYSVEYLLNGAIPGTVILQKTEYTKEKVLELALAQEKAKHPDIGEIIRGES